MTAGRYLGMMYKIVLIVLLATLYECFGAFVHRMPSTPSLIKSCEIGRVGGIGYEVLVAKGYEAWRRIFMITMSRKSKLKIRQPAKDRY